MLSQFANLGRGIFFAFMLCLIPSLAGAKHSSYEQRCGDYLFRIVGHMNNWAKYYLYSIHQKSAKATMFYVVGLFDDIDATCVKSRTGHHYLFFREHAPGDAQTTMHYGLFDPVKGRLVLQPNKLKKSNADELFLTLGRLPPDLDNGFEKKRFCC